MRDDIDRMLRLQIRSSIIGAVLGAIIIAAVITCIQMGHEPIF